MIAEDSYLYHWSPTSRRKSILRTGFEPGKWSTDRTWKPPYVAFALNPELAWNLSAATGRGQLVESWDLWVVYAGDLDGYEVLPFDNRLDEVSHDIKEIRVYHRIMKRFIWFSGTRTQNGEKELGK